MVARKPIISIIIPMYNVEKYVRRCLDSVLNQSFEDWQAICIDDGCTDKSGKIAKEYASRDKRFSVLKQEHQGPSGARNVGFSHAKGEYVMCLDGDDFIHPQTMELTLFLANSFYGAFQFRKPRKFMQFLMLYLIFFFFISDKCVIRIKRRRKSIITIYYA